MTRSDHVSGSDRIGEVAQKYPGLDIVVNVQGDEPEIAGQSIDQVITLLDGDPDSVMVSELISRMNELTEVNGMSKIWRGAGPPATRPR